MSKLIDGPLYGVDLFEDTRIAFSFVWIRILFTNVYIQLVSILLCLLQCLRCNPSIIFTFIFPEFFKFLLEVLSVLFLKHFG